MQQPVDHNLIKKFLKGACSPEEEARVKDFMQQPQSRQMFEEVLNEGWGDEQKEDKQQLSHWQAKFSERVKEERGTRGNKQTTTWLKYAAGWAAILLLAGSLFWKYSSNSTPENTVAAIQETHNTHGKLVKIKLSDSSTVMMNAATKLRYPASFNGKTREVYLDGEAFFDIKHDSQHPFIVHTSNVTVNVLGTSFNVKAYTGDKDVSVAVSTGKVGVLTKGSSKAYMLLPGDELAYNVDNTLVTEDKVDLADINSWQTGMFVYHNETLNTICKQLERWYGVSINIESAAIAQMRFNLKQKNDSLENVLSTLKFAGKIHYRINGKQVSIW